MAATRLPRPWDSPGKNSGVGCHFLLQCMKVKSENEFAQSCPTLRKHMDCSPPGSSVHGIFQARVLEWGAIAFSIHWSIFLFFVLVLYCLDNCSFVVYLKSGRLILPALFFFLKTALAIQGLLCFHRNVNIFVLVL